MSSFPEDFISRMKNQLPEAEFEAFIDALNSDPIVSIRTNPHKPAEYTGEPIPWHPDGLYLETRPSFVSDPRFHAGAYYVQEAASMLIHAMLPDMNRPMRILDLCAAPGGKSTLLAGAMSTESVLVSNEVIFSRAKTLAENTTRWGNPNVVVTHADPKEFTALEGFFDLILVDAPCSGEGMFRKDAGAIEEWSVEHVGHCAARQGRILHDIIPALAPGGTLIYSTCTFAPEENEARLVEVCERFPHMKPAPVALPEVWGAQAIGSEGTISHAYQCYPHRLKGEGLFVARLDDQREPVPHDTASASFAAPRKQKRGKKTRAPKGKRHSSKKSSESNLSIPELLTQWTTANETWGTLIPEIHEENLKVFTSPVKAVLPALQSSRIHIIQAGTTVGKMHRKGLNPSHELALSTLVRPDAPSLELDHQGAIRYLKKEDWADSSASPGFHIVQYQGVALGWAKGISGRWKNYLPINWRIRVDI